MKKIIIVNNNMKIGGVQKSLYNLLWSIDTVNEYDVTLLLFSKSGEYAEELPESIKIVETKGLFRFLGKSQDEYKNSLSDTLIRGFFALVARIFSRDLALRLMLIAEPKLEESYDCAISFLHNGRKKAFYGGTQDYVLNCIKAKNKVAFIHGDYRRCGANYEANNLMMAEFDIIAACSDGCRNAFVSVLPDLKSKTMTVRNFHRFDKIRELSEDAPQSYDDRKINIVTVARLSHEKGIDRAVNAVEYCCKKGVELNLYIVGGGVMYEELKTLVQNKKLQDNVVFCGERSNPYRYMKNADLFVLTSYHEAAPMVIDESRCLGVPVLTTETSSSHEMVTEMECGWVCENSQQALNEALYRVVSDKKELTETKNKLLGKNADNQIALQQFEALVEN